MRTVAALKHADSPLPHSDSMMRYYRTPRGCVPLLRHLMLLAERWQSMPVMACDEPMALELPRRAAPGSRARIMLRCMNHSNAPLRPLCRQVGFETSLGDGTESGPVRDEGGQPGAHTPDAPCPPPVPKRER